MDIERIDVILQKDCHFDKSRTVILGVSGGPDSLCLVDVMARLGYPVVVAHFDHQIRPEAGEDAARVAEMAKERGYPFVLGSRDVPVMSAQQGLSVEEAARIARYRFLFETARARGAQGVAVGHTADDQVETVLIHLLRGAGLSGLKGMQPCAVLPEWDVALPLVRPLLAIWRAETLAYCRERGLNPIFDPSNQDPTYFRNRLRHELIPYLETYNPRFREALFRTASSLGDDAGIVRQTVEQAWGIVKVGEGVGFVSLDASRLSVCPPGLRRRLVRWGIETLRPGLRDIDFSDVALALRFLDDPPRTGQAGLANGLCLFWEAGRVYLLEETAELPTTDRPQMKESGPLRLEVPGQVSLDAGRQIRAEWVDRSAFESERLSATPAEAYLDAARLTLPLTVRTRQDGDRIYPLGQGGHSIKLSDFFINEKLPRRYRAAWPLVCSGADIAWVPGYRLAEPFQVSPETRDVIRLSVL